MFTFADREVSTISEIIRLAYEDISCTDVWTGILSRIETLIPADASAAIFFDADTGKPEKYANRGFDAGLYHAYEQYYYSREPILAKALAAGAYVWRPEDMVPRHVWEDTEMYADFMGANGFRQFVTSVVKFGSGVSIWLRLARTDERHPFTDRDVRLLRLVQPHFSAAHAKLSRTTEVERLRAAVLSSFDRTESPIFIFDQSINLVHINDAARGLCGGPESPSESVMSRVKTAAGNIIRSERHPFHTEDASKEVGFTVNGRKYALAMFPIHLAGSAPYFVVFASDVMQHVRLAWRRSMSAYGLSARETEVCELLVMGLSNREIADRLYVAELTIKDHAKSIREKLRVSSRSQILPRLLSH